MKFLALQTNVGELKKQYIPEGEHEIMTVSRHPIRFVIDFFFYTVIVFVIGYGLSAGVLFWEGDQGALVFAGLLALLGIVYFFAILNSYISYRYNFLIITSDKIVVVGHTSFFGQKMDSVHLASILNTRFRTQFFGIVRCGILEIHMNELAGGGVMRTLVLPYIPSPDTVASAIENAMAMKSQKKPGTEGPLQQEMRAQNIKEELVQQAGSGGAVTPSEVAPKDPAQPPE